MAGGAALASERFWVAHALRFVQSVGLPFASLLGPRRIPFEMLPQSIRINRIIILLTL